MTTGCLKTEIGSLMMLIGPSKSRRKGSKLRESEDDWQKTVQKWKLFLRQASPTSELIDVQMTGLRARAKMRVSVRDGESRFTDVTYDYWLFENGDWFLDDASRTE